MSSHQPTIAMMTYMEKGWVHVTMTVCMVARPTCPLLSFMQDTLWDNAAWTVHDVAWPSERTGKVNYEWVRPAGTLARLACSSVRHRT